MEYKLHAPVQGIIIWSVNSTTRSGSISGIEQNGGQHGTVKTELVTIYIIYIHRYAWRLSELKVLFSAISRESLKGPVEPAAKLWLR